MRYLKDRMDAGEYRAVIDRRYPLDAIADAYRYVETGQKTGIVVVDVIQPQAAASRVASPENKSSSSAV
jgi:hypothetical protein